MRSILLTIFAVLATAAAIVITPMVVLTMMLFWGGVDENAEQTRQAERLPAAMADYRAGRGSLDALAAFVPMALASQADRNWNHPREAAWRPEFGELFDILRANGRFPDGFWRPFAQEAVDFRLETVDRVPAGEPIMCRLTMLGRVGPATRLRAAFRASFQIDNGPAFDAPLRFADEDVRDMANTPWFGLVVPPAIAATLKDGPHSIGGTVDIDVYDALMPSPATLPATSPAPIAHRQALLYGNYTQIPPGTAAAPPAFDDTARVDLGRHVRLGKLSPGLGGRGSLMIDFDTRGLADAYRCSVWLRAGDDEWLLSDQIEFSPVSGLTLGALQPLGMGQTEGTILLRPAGSRPAAKDRGGDVVVGRITHQSR